MMYSYLVDLRDGRSRSWELPAHGTTPLMDATRAYGLTRGQIMLLHHHDCYLKGYTTPVTLQREVYA